MCNHRSADSFFDRPSCSSVGAVFLGGAILLPPKFGLPVPAVPTAFGVAIRISPSLRLGHRLGQQRLEVSTVPLAPIHSVETMLETKVETTALNHC